MINSGFIIVWYENRCYSSGGAAWFAFASHVQRSAWRWSRITRVHLQSIDLPGPRGWGPVATFRVLLILEPYVFSSSHVLIWRSCRSANRVASGILFCAVGSRASRTAVSGLDWTVNSCALRATISCCLLSLGAPTLSLSLSRHPPYPVLLWLLFCLRSIHPFILKGHWPTWTECCLLLLCYRLSELSSKL